MIVASSVADVRRWRRTLSNPLAIVPTMGNLHEGHLSLVRHALRHATHVVVTIFVNPTQFGPNEDFQNYPRTLEHDLALLRAERADMVFTPNTQEIYPNGTHQATTIEVGDIANDLCGAFRPGHFTGVATVVCKLFNIVRPDIACFGEKDFQQLYVVRQLVRELNMPIEIIGVPTERAADGLALSSRNRYLSAEERQHATQLPQVLQTLKVRFARAEIDALEQWAEQHLRNCGFIVDYVRLRDAQTLRAVTTDTQEVVALAAARMGKTRLIDNLRFTLTQ